MHELTTTFKWKVGDRVTHISATRCPAVPDFPHDGTSEQKKEWRRARREDRFDGFVREPIYIIMGIMADACAGGCIQRHYRCRVTCDANGAITTATLQFHEEELRDLTPPEDPPPPEAPTAPLPASGG